MVSPIERIVKGAAKAPVVLYRVTLKPLLGHECRHLPTCSEYALDAIDLNGAWRGWWLTGARVCRCNPWGTSGYDPAPDIRDERHWLAPWRYGRWSQRGMEADQLPPAA
jgi:putative membrane protein insertion efficiency factor